MSEIRVECYAGQRADERPLRFVLRGRQFLVNELDGRWYSPDASYFRVLADDGNYYVLRHDEAQDFWTLDGFRSARRPQAEGAYRMTPVDLRRHERILVPDGSRIRAAECDGHETVEGVVTVISLGGMFLRSRNTRPPGTVLKLAFSSPVVSFETECTVRWVGENGIGVEFTGTTPDRDEKLNKLLRQLRAGSLN